MAHDMFFLSFLVTLGIYVVEYVVTKTAGNTPGGVRFNNEIGSEYSKCNDPRKSASHICVIPQKD